MFLNQINESISSRDTSINYLTGVWLQFQVENKQKTWKITSHLRFAAIFATKQNVATKRRASLDTSFQVCRVNGKLKQTNRQTTPANDKRLADVRRSTFPRCLISLIFPWQRATSIVTFGFLLPFWNTLYMKILTKRRFRLVNVLRLSHDGVTLKCWSTPSSDPPWVKRITFSYLSYC